MAEIDKLIFYVNKRSCVVKVSSYKGSTAIGKRERRSQRSRSYN